jgi:hypothetical protein
VRWFRHAGLDPANREEPDMFIDLRKIE